MRLNVLNAIPDHDCTTEPVSQLDVGARRGHRLGTPNRLHGSRESGQERDRRRTQLVVVDAQPAGDGADRRSGTSATWAVRSGWPRGPSYRTSASLGWGRCSPVAIAQSRSLVAGVPARVVRPLSTRTWRVFTARHGRTFLTTTTTDVTRTISWCSEDCPLRALFTLLLAFPLAANAQPSGPSGSDSALPADRPGLVRIGSIYLTPYLRIGTLGLDTNVFYTRDRAPHGLHGERRAGARDRAPLREQEPAPARRGPRLRLLPPDRVPAAAERLRVGARSTSRA